MAAESSGCDINCVEFHPISNFLNVNILVLLLHFIFRGTIKVPTKSRQCVYCNKCAQCSVVLIFIQAAECCELRAGQGET